MVILRQQNHAYDYANRERSFWNENYVLFIKVMDCYFVKCRK